MLRVEQTTNQGRDRVYITISLKDVVNNIRTSNLTFFNVNRNTFRAQLTFDEEYVWTIEDLTEIEIEAILEAIWKPHITFHCEKH